MNIRLFATSVLATALFTPSGASAQVSMSADERALRDLIMC
jgi:hypothetical protein